MSRVTRSTGLASVCLSGPQPTTSLTLPRCDAYPADTPDLSGYIVLIRRGSCTFVQKAQNAAAFGAKYVLFYNNVGGATGPSVTDVPEILATGMVSCVP